MDKEVVVHIHNGVLLSYKKKKSTFESVLMRWMKLEPIIQSEVSHAVTFNYLSLDTYLFLMVSCLMNNSSADGEKTRILNCHQAKN